MKFLSYNVRNALIGEEEKENEWLARREAVVEPITKADPDILALQEDSEEQRQYIEALLALSHRIYCDPAFYEADCSYNAILVRKSIEVLGSGAFWIADGGKEKSKLAASICFRHANYVRIRSAEKNLVVVNVHLDHASDPEFKTVEAETFIGLLKEISGAPLENTIALGDFNSAPDSPGLRPLAEAHLLDAAKLQNNKQPTYTGWGRAVTGERIDYVWLSEDLKSSLKSYRVLCEPYRRGDGSFAYPSDHCAVLAEFEF